MSLGLRYVPTLRQAIYDYHELYVDLECKLFTSSTQLFTA